MKNLTTILFLLIVLDGCKKSNNDNNSQSHVTDCSHNNFEAIVGGPSYKAVDVIIDTNHFGITQIYANTRPSTYVMPPDTFFNIQVVNSTPGIYYLGTIGAKRDSVNYYSGSASYSIDHTPSTGIGYTTDTTYNGILTITNKDVKNRQLYGTFSFKARKYGSSDTIVTITNGVFQGCY